MKEREFPPAVENFLYTLIKVLVRFLALLPRPWITPLSRAIGRLWFKLDKRHRDIAMDNLTHAYGKEKPPAEILRIGRDTFVHLAGVVLELPHMFKLNAATMKDFVELAGLNNAYKALRQDQSVVFLTAHYGNWELLALAVAQQFQIPIHVMARPLDLAPADRVLTEMRSHTGNVVLDKDKSAGAVAGLLKNRQSLGILLDQNASWYEGVYVPFFNRICCTNKGLAIFALRHGATVVPAFSRKRPDGIYDVEFLPALDLIRTGNIGKDIEANTALFNRVMESEIRKDPSQWLWVHRRWRIKDIPERALKKMGGLPEL
ncbi:MAG: lysophospholipid acyltransferase family protein [Desulfatibacillum sp.]|nr:lysophospholipid acyltransferase family protein [Desulfatibacillum sp.]